MINFSFLLFCLLICLPACLYSFFITLYFIYLYTRTQSLIRLFYASFCDSILLILSGFYFSYWFSLFYIKFFDIQNDYIFGCQKISADMDRDNNCLLTDFLSQMLVSPLLFLFFCDYFVVIPFFFFLLSTFPSGIWRWVLNLYFLLVFFFQIFNRLYFLSNSSTLLSVWKDLAVCRRLSYISQFYIEGRNLTSKQSRLKG